MILVIILHSVIVLLVCVFLTAKWKEGKSASVDKGAANSWFQWPSCYVGN